MRTFLPIASLESKPDSTEIHQDSKQENLLSLVVVQPNQPLSTTNNNSLINKKKNFELRKLLRLKRKISPKSSSTNRPLTGPAFQPLCHDHHAAINGTVSGTGTESNHIMMAPPSSLLESEPESTDHQQSFSQIKLLNKLQQQINKSSTIKLPGSNNNNNNNNSTRYQPQKITDEIDVEHERSSIRIDEPLKTSVSPDCDHHQQLLLPPPASINDCSEKQQQSKQSQNGHHRLSIESIIEIIADDQSPPPPPNSDEISNLSLSSTETIPLDELSLNRNLINDLHPPSSSSSSDHHLNHNELYSSRTLSSSSSGTSSSSSSSPSKYSSSSPTTSSKKLSFFDELNTGDRLVPAEEVVVVEVNDKVNNNNNNSAEDEEKILETLRKVVRICTKQDLAKRASASEVYNLLEECCVLDEEEQQQQQRRQRTTSSRSVTNSSVVTNSNLSCCSSNTSSSSSSSSSSTSPSSSPIATSHR